MRRSQRGTRLNWTASQLDWTLLQPLLSPFIPVPSYMQHLLMPAADPHWGDTLNGSLIRILVTLGHARNTTIPVTSSRTGFRALSSYCLLYNQKHVHKSSAVANVWHSFFCLLDYVWVADLKQRICKHQTTKINHNETELSEKKIKLWSFYNCGLYDIFSDDTHFCTQVKMSTNSVHFRKSQGKWKDLKWGNFASSATARPRGKSLPFHNP